MPKRPIDTEPDEVFEAVFGEAADRPFGAPGTPGPEDAGGEDLLDLDALELPDDIDEDAWAEADPEAGGVDPDADVPEAGNAGDAQDDGDVIDLDALELPDEVDESAWAAMEAEAEAEAAAATGGRAEAGGQPSGAVFDAEAAEALRPDWMARLDGGEKEFRLDLTGTSAVDAAGLAFLAAFARELDSRAGTLTVAAPERVREMLAVCGLGGRWPVVLEEAGEEAP